MRTREVSIRGAQCAQVSRTLRDDLNDSICRYLGRRMDRRYPGRARCLRTKRSSWSSSGCRRLRLDPGLADGALRRTARTRVERNLCRQDHQTNLPSFDRTFQRIGRVVQRGGWSERPRASRQSPSLRGLAGHVCRDGDRRVVCGERGPW